MHEPMTDKQIMADASELVSEAADELTSSGLNMEQQKLRLEELRKIFQTAANVIKIMVRNKEKETIH